MKQRSGVVALYRRFERSIGAEHFQHHVHSVEVSSIAFGAWLPENTPFPASCECRLHGTPVPRKDVKHGVLADLRPETLAGCFYCATAPETQQADVVPFRTAS